MKKHATFAFFILTFFHFLCAGLAQETKPKALESIEVLTGFGWGKLRAKQNYNLYPLIVDFDFDLKPLTNKLNLFPAQLIQFQIEPFISFVSSPDSNVEVGTALFFKIGLLPQSWKFQPYAKIGAGIVYMSQHTREQGMQFNFIEQGALGMHYLFRKNTAFTMEGRIRHLSDASITRPNSGINTYFVVAGLTYRF